MQRRTRLTQAIEAVRYGLPVAGLVFIGFFVVLWSLLVDLWALISRRPP